MNVGDGETTKKKKRKLSVQIGKCDTVGVSDFRRLRFCNFNTECDYFVSHFREVSVSKRTRESAPKKDGTETFT